MRSPHRRRATRTRFSLTFSPLHLLLPVFQITAEVRATPHFGVSLIGGYGKVGVDVDNGFSKDHVDFSAYEVGGRLVGYPFKKFKSLEFGAQLLYLRVDTDGAQTVLDVSASGSGEGLAVGPFIGYKLITEVGFTFFAQGGFQYLAIDAQAHDDEGTSDSRNEHKLSPLLNLDVGWSF